MAENDMETMLKELKEVDEETWQKIDAYGIGEWGHPDAFLDECIIQGCIQRAIATREWRLEQTIFRGGMPRYKAAIFCTFLPEIVYGDYIGHGDTPAAAILAAYVAAKRAMR